MLWLRTTEPKGIKDLKRLAKDQYNVVKESDIVTINDNEHDIINSIQNDEAAIPGYLESLQSERKRKKAYRGVGDIFSLHAETFLLLNKRNEAADCFWDAAQAYKVAKKGKRAQEKYLEAAEIYAKLAKSTKYAEAGEYYEKTYDAFHAAGDPDPNYLKYLYHAAVAYLNSANKLRNEGNLQDARENADKADYLYKLSKGIPYSKARSLINQIQRELQKKETIPRGEEPSRAEVEPHELPFEIHLIGEVEREEIEGVWKWSSDNPNVEIVFSRGVCKDIDEHAQSDYDNEVGGVLIGDVFDFGNERYQIQITDFIQGRFVVSEATEMKFTHETWAEIDKELQRLISENPRKKIVGWYHTHPGLDVFLSDKDLYIHENFFKEPWQIALVVDPKQDLGGFFTWRKDNTIPDQTEQKFKVSEVYQPSDPDTTPSDLETPESDIVSIVKEELEQTENNQQPMRLNQQHDTSQVITANQQVVPPKISWPKRFIPLATIFSFLLVDCGLLSQGLFNKEGGILHPYRFWIIGLEVAIVAVPYIWAPFTFFRQKTLSKSIDGAEKSKLLKFVQGLWNRRKSVVLVSLSIVSLWILLWLVRKKPPSRTDLLLLSGLALVGFFLLKKRLLSWFGKPEELVKVHVEKSSETTTQTLPKRTIGERIENLINKIDKLNLGCQLLLGAIIVCAFLFLVFGILIPWLIKNGYIPLR